ncbi:hypothetical protein HY621_04045 [Candidatus Uhrbacteria bacterium]|nr:hypothetical protein [Candidatus Uhrbacteria bacterium]
MGETGHFTPEQQIAYLSSAIANLQDAFGQRITIERDRKLANIVEFYEPVREKVKLMLKVLSQSERLRKEHKEYDTLYKNMQLYFLREFKIQERTARTLLSDLFLLRYAKNQRIKRGEKQDLPEVLTDLFKDARLTERRDHRGLSSTVLLEKMLLYPVAERSVFEEPAKGKPQGKQES